LHDNIIKEINMKVLARFYWDYGRMGELNCIFIAEEEDVYNLIGKEIYFGEVLGKHSEVEGTIEERDITIISEDQDFINKCEEVFGSKTISGYNPLNYIEEEEEEKE
jgi:hypothetical protein